MSANAIDLPHGARVQDINVLVNSFDILRVGFAVVLLLIGQFDPEDRMIVAGLPLNTCLAIAAAFFVLITEFYYLTLARTVLLLLPLNLLGLSTLWSPDAAYGFWKYGNLLGIVLVCIALVQPAIQRSGVIKFAKLWTAIYLVLLLIAIVFKMKTGFFDRNEPYFINGPIVFARLMGVAALMCWIAYRAKKRIFMVTLFGLAVVWTASKGPIMFLLVPLAIYMWQRGAMKMALLSAFFFMIGASVMLVFGEQLQGNSFARIIETYDYLMNDGEVPSSISSRLGMFTYSFQVIADNLWGVGFGGWAYDGFFVQPWPYPHNIFLELFSELGLILGIIAAIPFVIFLFYPRSPFFSIALFLMLCQQTSGDLLDARYLLFFSVLCVYWPRREITGR